MPAFQATIAYADETFANKYFGESTGPNAETWADAANQAKKTPALKQATRIMDDLHYIGRKAKEDQISEFPRGNDEEIPYEVAEACCEVAVALLSGKTLEEIEGSDGIASESVGDASTSYSEDGQRETLNKNGQLPSAQAFRLLRPWIVNPRDIHFDRV